MSKRERRKLLFTGKVGQSLMMAYLALIPLVALHANSVKSPFLYQVIDAETLEPLPIARIVFPERGMQTYTDGDGIFRIAPDQVNNSALKVSISYLGYAPYEGILPLGNSSKPTIIKLSPSTFALETVEVLGEKSKRESGTSMIRETALEYLQPTSLRDVFVLTPGGLVRNPTFSGVQQAQMREVLTSPNSALGTSIMLDDAPISNDANLQGMANHNHTLENRTMMNVGIDLREISIDHIETIEIIQGIPSVQYGNLTSGLIKLTTKIGQSPINIRVQADPYTKLTSVGKGYNINHLQNIYLGVDYTKGIGSLTNPISDYQRITGLAKYSYTARGAQAFSTSWTLQYTGTLNQRKYDPEVMNSREGYKNNYNRVMLSGRLTQPLASKWIEKIDATLSVSYAHDLIEQEKYIIPNQTLILPTNKVEGESEGVYLTPVYFTEFDTDGRPFNLFAQLRTHHRFDTDWLSGFLLLGGDLKIDKNFGLGTIYDALLPPNPGSPTSSRPIAYRDIPATMPISLFAEQSLYWDMNKGWLLDARLGMRMTFNPLLAQHGFTHLRKPIIEPRIQGSLRLPTFRIKEKEMEIRITAGYGRHFKMPTLAYLYPEPAYIDLIEANYYHNQPENRLLWIRTYVRDRNNKDLQANQEDKLELGINLTWSGFKLYLSAFQHTSMAGFEYRPIPFYAPLNRYTYSGELGKGKPTLDLFQKEVIHQTLTYSQPDNCVRTEKRGIEYSLQLPRVEAIKTNFTIQGAWYKTLYGSSLPMAYRPPHIFMGRQFPYIGFYEGYGDRIYDQFHTLVRTDTHIPTLSMIFSTTLQTIWFAGRQSLPYSTYPTYWYDEMGQRLNDFDSQDRELQKLILPNPAQLFEYWKEPLSLSFNMKLTKEIGKRIKISMFVNNLLTYDPIYKSNLDTKHQKWKNPFFGSEIRIEI